MKRGFTLIEVLVSVALFTVVMVIALGALLAISSSDRKAESLKSVINNLNFSIDSMSRAVRTGVNWGCDASHTFNPTAGTNCATGGNEIMFTSSSGVVTYYRLESAGSPDGNGAAICGQKSPNIGCIAKSTDGVSWLPITSPEVVITDYSGNVTPSYLFYMSGATPADNTQPIVTITLSGFVTVTGGATSQAQCGTASNQCSVFHLQTSVTQRIYDQ